ncbi:MAG: transglycosylase domain-containing protein [Eubacteriales bacterium]
MKKKRDAGESRGNGNGRAKRRGMAWLNALLCFVLVSSVLVVGALVWVYVWAEGQIDFERELELYDSLKGSTTTRIYENAAARTFGEDVTLQTYVPREYRRVYADENCVWAEEDELPQMLKDAFVSIEDHRFYEHDGVDWRRTAKAAFNYLFHFDEHFGGSSITQQLVKNLSGEYEVSARRKLKEMLRALKLEKHYEKEEILTYYLNVVPMAQNCLGVGAAAAYYFDKKPLELSLAECAALAAITNAPSYYDPIRFPENNRARRNLVLDQMRLYGKIDEAACEAAKQETLRLAEDAAAKKHEIYDWYTEAVLTDVIRDLQEKLHYGYETASRMVYGGGLEIYALVDSEAQGIMEAYFANEKTFYGYAAQGLPNYAMTLIDPYSGDLLATTGGIGEKTANRVLHRGNDTTAPPGSALKPLALYAPALEAKLIHYATVFTDVPEFRQTAGGKFVKWPHNYPEIYHGLIGAHEALAYSKNTVAVQLYKKLGAEKVYRTLQDLGISTLVRSAPGSGGGVVSDLAPSPLALGQLSHGVTVRELSAAFAPFANGGLYRESRSYLAVYDKAGKLLLDNQTKKERRWSPETAYIMTMMLSEVVEYGTGKPLTLKYTVDTAGKTGTSGEDYDRWFVGYTPYLLAGVHIGHDTQNRAVGNAGKSHLQVWDEVMTRLHKKYFSAAEIRSFERPAGVVRRAYCKDSGRAPGAFCQLDLRRNRTASGYFTPDNLPHGSCDRHALVSYHLVTGEVSEGQFGGIFTIPIALLRGEKPDYPIETKTLDQRYFLWYNLKDDKEEEEPLSG